MFGANMLALEANATKVRGYDICCQFYCNTSFTVLFIHYISASVFIYTYVYTYTQQSVVFLCVTINDGFLVINGSVLYFL